MRKFVTKTVNSKGENRGFAPTTQEEFSEPSWKRFLEACGNKYLAILRLSANRLNVKTRGNREGKKLRNV